MTLLKETNPPVICDYNDPPDNPMKGQRFGILERPTGSWIDHPNGIAEWDGTKWKFTDPKEGMVVYNDEEGKAFLYTGNEWVDCED